MISHRKTGFSLVRFFFNNRRCHRHRQPTSVIGGKRNPVGTLKTELKPTLRNKLPKGENSIQYGLFVAIAYAFSKTVSCPVLISSILSST